MTLLENFVMGHLEGFVTSPSILFEVAHKECLKGT
jgi:hypothetical protein